MKKALLALALVSIGNVIQAMVTLPSAITIEEALCNIGLFDLTQKTKIGSELANKELYTTDIKQIINHHILCYHHYYEKELGSFSPLRTFLMELRKPVIARSLLNISKSIETEIVKNEKMKKNDQGCIAS